MKYHGQRGTIQIVEPRCSNCRFWFDLELAEGFCRRYPPVVSSRSHCVRFNALDLDAVTHWPKIKANGWCGEHQRGAVSGGAAE